MYRKNSLMTLPKLEQALTSLQRDRLVGNTDVVPRLDRFGRNSIFAVSVWAFAKPAGYPVEGSCSRSLVRCAIAAYLPPSGGHRLLGDG